MDETLSDEDAGEALKLSNNGKAPGIDGLPNEFYKILEILFRQTKGSDQESFNAIGFLTNLYDDIEKYGMVKVCKFNMGWVGPIFKKGDRSLISNYQPVTLLNCDYKLMTKSYSLHLMNVAPSLVHPDQACFMKGRRIEDQVKLAKFLSNHAEAAEEDGTIVALDQEKAYDRINHTYSLRVLEHMGFPPKFCNTVKSLYINVEIVVVVNGEISESFIVIQFYDYSDKLGTATIRLSQGYLSQISPNHSVQIVFWIKSISCSWRNLVAGNRTPRFWSYAYDEGRLHWSTTACSNTASA
jgi:hypothetical protein